jgi:hypothetical protein
LIGKPERKRPCGRPRRRWEDSINMDLQEMRWQGVGLIDVAEGRDRWTGGHGDETLCFMKRGGFIDWLKNC